MRLSISIAAALGLAACGQPAPSRADAQTQATTSQAEPSASLTPADRTAILNAIHAAPDARGQVANACDEKVTSQFIAIDLGGALGAAQPDQWKGSSYAEHGEIADSAMGAAQIHPQ